MILTARSFMLSSLLFTHQSNAQGNDAQKYTFDGIPIVKRTVFEDSSRVLREGRKFSVLFGASLTGRKAVFEYFYDPNNLAFYSIETQKTPNHIVAHSIGWKRFLGDTFYLAGGYFYKISDFAYTRQRASGATAAIGNIWLFSNLQVGGEWLQVFQTVFIHEGDRNLKVLPHSFRFLIGVAY